MSAARDCQHGAQARACRVCELEAEVEKWQKNSAAILRNYTDMIEQRNRLDEEAHRLKAEIERLHERLDSALGQNANLIAENKRLRETVSEYNGLLRSTAQIAARSGESVEWASFTHQVAICLARNHPVWLSAVAGAIDAARGES